MRRDNGRTTRGRRRSCDPDVFGSASHEFALLSFQAGK
ncbi:hypothetical protein PATSB16_27200 [Pandoraea thiooxydans]|nr:hypothetical protein PATSB16_27200 [Pandoraea thiooxydans]